MGWRGDAQRAAADARHLRDLYGARAEAWCANALGALPPGDPRRRSIQLIAKALRGLPVADAGQGVPPPVRPVEPGLHPRR